MQKSNLAPIVLLFGWMTWCTASNGDEGTTTVRVNNSEEFQQAVRAAKPGTTILIAPGEYRGSFHFPNLQGSMNRPIVLAASEKANTPVFQGGLGMHLSDPAFVELDHLVLAESKGNGLNIDDGGTAETPAHHVVLRGLTIRGAAPEGNRDGIKLSGLDQFRVESCVVERWGTSGSGIDMVGCHQGEINDCTFRHDEANSANGVQTKGASSDIKIQRCRFENAGGRALNVGGSTGENYFRPKGATYEAKDITVQDCTVIGSSAAISFVGVDGAVVQFNTIYCPSRYVLQILQESRGPEFTPSRNGRFSNNLVVFRGAELRGAVNAGSGTAPETFQFSNNHWYCSDRPERSHRLNLPVPETNAVHGTDPQFLDVEKKDLRLRDTSPVRNAGVRKSPAG